VVRVGCATPRRLGTAVRRNRVRRVLREALRHAVAQTRGNWDVVIVPQPAAASAGADDLRAALGALLGGLGIC
jgi:ribonuclease P protein component